VRVGMRPGLFPLPGLVPLAGSAKSMAPCSAGATGPTSFESILPCARREQAPPLTSSKKPLAAMRRK